MKKYLLLLSLFCLIISTGCPIIINGEPICSGSQRYDFEIPYTLTPALETYQIGDTIFINSQFSDEVYERNADTTFKLTDFKFYPEMTITKIDTVEGINSMADFEVILDEDYNLSINTYQDNFQILHGQYSYNNGLYDLQYALIPQKIGLYLISNASTLSIFGEDQDFPDKHCNGSIGATVALNDGAANNIHLLEESPDDHYNTWVLEKPDVRFHRGGGYAFYVVE